MSPDYELHTLPNWWVHPETKVTIFAEDMPAELMPDTGGTAPHPRPTGTPSALGQSLPGFFPLSRG